MGSRNLLKVAQRVTPYFQHPADPPKRCVEPLIYGENILNDPSFERQAGITGGPIPNSIPEDGLTGTTSCQTGAKWITSGLASTWPCAPGNTYWVNTGSTSSVNYWRTSTVDPRSGLYHVRWVRPAESNNNVILNPRMGINCIPVFGGFFGTYSARCEPGDTVTTSVYMKASTLTNGPQIQIHINWYDIDYGSAGAASSSTAVNLTTSYANYSHSGVAPATTRFAYIEWVPITGGGYPVGATLDADDGLVGVEAA